MNDRRATPPSGETYEMGQRVTVVMSRNDHFPWQTAPHFEASLVRKSRGAGDTFCFIVNIENEEGTEGLERIIEMNGNSSEFVGYHYEEGDPG